MAPFVYCVLSAAVAPAGSLLWACVRIYDMQSERAQMTASVLSAAAQLQKGAVVGKGSTR